MDFFLIDVVLMFVLSIYFWLVNSPWCFWRSCKEEGEWVLAIKTACEEGSKGLGVSTEWERIDGMRGSKFERQLQYVPFERRRDDDSVPWIDA